MPVRTGWKLGFLMDGRVRGRWWMSSSDTNCSLSISDTDHIDRSLIISVTFFSQPTYVWMLRAGYFDIALRDISTHKAPHLSSWSITVTLCWISPERSVVRPSPYKVKFLYDWHCQLNLPIMSCWIWPPNINFIGNFLFQWLSSLEYFL